MARLLVKAVSVSNIDPDKDKFCYKKGDIVFVYPDSYKPGKGETSPNFVFIDVPGKPEDFNTYVESKIETLDIEPEVTLRRKYGLSKSVVDNAISGTKSITALQFEGSIADKGK